VIKVEKKGVNGENNPLDEDGDDTMEVWHQN
jgi:hypothetical protein